MVNESEFENLAKLGYEITSDPDEAYNCFAYAAGVVDEWWDPLGKWPGGNPERRCRRDARHGLRGAWLHGMPRRKPERGFDKIAIYAIEGSFQHAAKLLDDGRWSSKLGPDGDIAHRDLAALEGRRTAKSQNI